MTGRAELSALTGQTTTSDLESVFAVNPLPWSHEVGVVYDANGEYLAYLADANTAAAQDALAQLWVAAPDLLAACKGMITYLETVSSDADRYHGEAVHPMRAAIAQAERAGTI